MSNHNISWGVRFALIEKFKPEDDVACAAFGVSHDELATARDLQESGTLSMATDVDTNKYVGIFDNVEMPAKKTTVTSVVKPKTTKAVAKPVAKPVAKKAVASVPKKRGRKGSKITKAFAAVPATATDAETFAKTQGVSIAVLRQAKRFDQSENGIVKVRKNRESGSLEIWRENTSTS